MLMKSLTQNIVEAKAREQAIRSFLHSLSASGFEVGVIALSPDQAVITQCHSALEVGEILIPIKHFSPTGEHDYLDYALKGFERIPNHLILDEVIEQLRGLGSNADFELFAKRIRSSCEVITRALYKRRFELHTLYANNSISYLQAEQMLVFGHPSHPYPKLREGFNEQDLELYSPEFAGSFNLQWLAVQEDAIRIHYKNENSLKTLAQIEGLDYHDGFELLPMHPWQWQRLKKLPWVNDLLTAGKIKELNSAEKYRWSATTSVRTIYAEHSKIMLKYSLDVRITNSIRHLQENEVVRGMQFIDVMNTEKGREFKLATKNFNILTEPGYAGLIDPKGQLHTASIVTWRDNPFTSETAINAINLSALTQVSPFDNSNLLLKRIPAYRENILEWFDHYLQVVLTPFLIAAGDFGFYFGAHQQNIILKLSDAGLPTEVYFRDCQGTGYEASAYKELGLTHASNGNDVSREIGNKLIGYYLIINSAFGVTSALARTNLVAEKELLVRLRSFLQSLPRFKDHSFVNYLLESEFIYKKNNFICSLDNHNENTIDNPFALYHKIENPIYAAR